MAVLSVLSDPSSDVSGGGLHVDYVLWRQRIGQKVDHSKSDDTYKCSALKLLMFSIIKSEKIIFKLLISKQDSKVINKNFLKNLKEISLNCIL